ncbi:uncharacterized protein proca1 [Erpetoichthys calabaricus]|uniref:uncharacterized protein proca1 n=1 Tax=Erpetoichthys calabaricus TaxID=27687 RepID=UPI0022346DEC|nr:uncharacterized protein proca1 [Erpetoichthys calabaricus]
MWSVFLVFLSYLDRNFVKGELLGLYPSADMQGGAQYFMLNSTFCSKNSYSHSSAGVLYVHQVSDGVEVARSVLDQGGALVECSVITSPMDVKSFMHECRLGVGRQRHRRPEGASWVTADVVTAKSKCQSFQRSPNARMRNKILTRETGKDNPILRRSKRGFTYPGTLWCGVGNNADTYDHLGDFAETDKCCREHDHCKFVIHPFTSKYGYRNFRWHTVCHCDCDNALKECLRNVNDTSSRVIGQAFFNVIEVPCFELRYEEQCVERFWYGWCKTYGMVPVAEIKESIPYDFGGVSVIDELTIAPSWQVKNKTSSGNATPTATAIPITTSTAQTTTSVSITRQPPLVNLDLDSKVLSKISTSQPEVSRPCSHQTEKRRNKKKPHKKKNSKKCKKFKKLPKPSQKLEILAVTPGSVAEIIKYSKFGFTEANEWLNGKENSKKGADPVAANVLDEGTEHHHFNEVMNDEPVREASTPPPTSLKSTTIETKTAGVKGKEDMITIKAKKVRKTQQRKKNGGKKRERSRGVAPTSSLQ